METLQSAIAQLLNKQVELTWSKIWDKTDASKADGYRFIGEWDKPSTPTEIIQDGLHVAVVVEIKGYEKFEWRKIPGKVRKSWQSTGEILPPEPVPTAKNGTEKFEQIAEKTAIAYLVSNGEVSIKAQVPWGKNWGLALNKALQSDK